MTGVTLREILAPPGLVTPSGDDPLGGLDAKRLAITPGHPLARAARRATRAGRALWRVPLGGQVEFVSLGSEHRAAGLAVCVSTAQSVRNGGVRAAWVVWGLPRPSVNLFLAPALAQISKGIANHPTSEKMLELVRSKAFLERHIETRVRVEHVLEPLTFRIYPDAPAGEIQHLMLRRGLQVVPVVGRAHELLGVIESGDVLRNILPRREAGSACGNRNRKDLSARDLMTRSILCVSEGEDLANACHSLVSRGMSRLPVVTNGRLVGFVSRETVMRAFADAFPTTHPPKRIEPY